MAPIRTAIVGLSSSAKTSWASNAHLPYLLSPRGREKFTIVALLNSSVSAAKAAIQHFDLPASTRAYGDSGSLAADANVELVVVSTRVDVHHDSALASVRAGKTVYVEWPLAKNAQQVDSLVEAAEASGSQTIVGLQGELAPVIVAIRRLLEQGRIGKVLSSEVYAAGGTNSRDEIIPTLGYFFQRDVGGNVVTIGFGHLFDQVQHVLGELQDIQSHLQLQRPVVKVRDASTGEIAETIHSDVPDLIIATGSLPGSATAHAGASVLLRFRRGQPFKTEPALEWTINGEKGEVRIISRGGTALHAGAYSEPVVIEIHDFETDTVEEVPWEWEDWQLELPMLARSVGAVYERIAERDYASVPSFRKSQVRHSQLDGILASWKPQ